MIPNTSCYKNICATKLSNLDNLLQGYIDRGELPGFVTLIAQGEKTHYCKARGYRDVESQSPYQKDTIVRIFSMTKPVASVALLQLFEQGLFQLNDPVSDVLPEFSDMQVYEDGDLVKTHIPVSFRHILTHTAGLSYGSLGGIDPGYVDQQYDAAKLFDSRQSLANIVSKLAQLPLRFQPGSQWHYSMATDVVGRLVEVLSGMPFGSYVEKHIFLPLKMLDTSFELVPEKQHRLASLYQRKDDCLMSLMESSANSKWLAPVNAQMGGSGLLSTAADYLRFCRCLLADGILDDERILQSETVQLMQQNQLPDSMLPIKFEFSAPFSGLGFGLGVAVTQDISQSSVAGSNGDFGWGGFAETVFWIDPQHDLIGINLTQCIPSGAYPIRKQIRQIVYEAMN